MQIPHLVCKEIGHVTIDQNGIFRYQIQKNTSVWVAAAAALQGQHQEEEGRHLVLLNMMPHAN